LPFESDDILLALIACPAGQLDGLQEALDVLLGSPHLVLRDIGSAGGNACAWEVLICPGDGGVGIEGYRPLASRLSKARVQLSSICLGV